MDQAVKYGNDDRSFDDIIRFVAESAKDMRAFPKALSTEPIETLLPELRKAAKRIGSKVSRRPPPLERYMLQWRQFAAGDTRVLDRGTVRYLCWDSSIATSALFLEYLRWSESKLSRRSIEGLVRSCHNKWEGDFIDSGSVGKVRTFIETYQGSNPVLQRWRSSLDAVLGTNGPLSLARDMVMKAERLSPYLNEWYLAPQSPFVGVLVKEATAECRKRLGSGARATLELLFTDLLPWPYWKLHDLKEELGHLILHAATSGQIKERLHIFVLRHKEFGDPTMKENRMNWAEVNPKARSRFIEWLMNGNDLTFFDHVYRYGSGWAWELREKQSTLGPDRNLGAA
jgi:hypothetical protein